MQRKTATRQDGSTRTWYRVRYLAALRRRNCDVLRGRLYIADNVTEVTGQGLVVDTPKPHRAEAVRIPRFVAEILAEHLARQPDLDEAIAFPAPRGGMLR